MRSSAPAHLARGGAILAFASMIGFAALCAFSTSASAQTATPSAAPAAAPAAMPPVGWKCGAPSKNTFSDAKTPIAIENPVNLDEVPAFQLDCDFHSFAWNQFIYLVQTVAPNDGSKPVPRFMTMAPWYNILGKQPVGAYPGGKLALEAGKLNIYQAGSKDILKDVHGFTVLYDIRFNQPMFDFIKQQGLNTAAGFKAKCKPDAKSGICANQIWLPPTGAAGESLAGAMEIKTAWTYFRTGCPADEFYCDGKFGLIGIHIVQKTATHGEWIWASFEHAANAPDCVKGGDSPIATQSPVNGFAWSFFNPKTAGAKVMSTQTCDVTSKSPACNGNPKGRPLGQIVNVCRTNTLPPGGATNCGSDAAQPNTLGVTPAERDAQNRKLVACLNGSVPPLLSGVWQYYKLVGTQWTDKPLAGNQDFRIQVFQPPLLPLPYKEPVGLIHMANVTMETFVQEGSTGYDPIHSNATHAGCFNCHQPPSTGHTADLSHFPLKLPPAALQQYLKALKPAE